MNIGIVSEEEIQGLKDNSTNNLNLNNDSPVRRYSDVNNNNKKYDRESISTRGYSYSKTSKGSVSDQLVEKLYSISFDILEVSIESKNRQN